jgi:hypothetical protein
MNPMQRASFLVDKHSHIESESCYIVTTFNNNRWSYESKECNKIKSVSFNIDFTKKDFYSTIEIIDDKARKIFTDYLKSKGTDNINDDKKDSLLKLSFSDNQRFLSYLNLLIESNDFYEITSMVNQRIIKYSS